MLTWVSAAEHSLELWSLLQQHATWSQTLMASLFGKVLRKADKALMWIQVVGHTIQEQGINSACGEKVFRIDVGLSKGCGDGEPEVRVT